jgi:hypothetical protein
MNEHDIDHHLTEATGRQVLRTLPEGWTASVDNDLVLAENTDGAWLTIWVAAGPTPWMWEHMSAEGVKTRGRCAEMYDVAEAVFG